MLVSKSQGQRKAETSPSNGIISPLCRSRPATANINDVLYKLQQWLDGVGGGGCRCPEFIGSSIGEFHLSESGFRALDLCSYHLIGRCNP
ncbi:hypothetical protein PS1_039969 [Malus domestica]